MRFMLIVKAGQKSETGAPPDAAMLEAMGKFNEEMAKAGVLLDLSGLHPSKDGARVHFSGQKRSVVDGPFAETKELIGGYWLIQCKSKEEAIEWARRSPNPGGPDAEAVIEVRRVAELADFAELTAPAKQSYDAVAKKLGQ